MASTASFRRTGPLLVIAGTLMLGGCASRSMQARADFADIPDDYRERHSVVVGDVRQSIDIFLAANGGLDHRQRQDLAAFVREHRERGKGPMVASLPPNAPAAAVRFTLSQIRQTAPQVMVASGPTHPTAAAIRLSFAALDAKVASQCGQWPYDPAGGTTLQTWTNKPMYNLGCSQQSMMAAQVANPLDHVRPRQEGPYDLERRMKDMKELRDGKDPSTQWQTQTTKISGSF